MSYNDIYPLLIIIHMINIDILYTNIVDITKIYIITNILFIRSTVLIYTFIVAYSQKYYDI